MAVPPPNVSAAQAKADGKLGGAGAKRGQEKMKTGSGQRKSTAKASPKSAKKKTQTEKKKTARVAEPEYAPSISEEEVRVLEILQEQMDLQRKNLKALSAEEFPLRQKALTEEEFILREESKNRPYVAPPVLTEETRNQRHVASLVFQEEPRNRQLDTPTSPKGEGRSRNTQLDAPASPKSQSRANLVEGRKIDLGKTGAKTKELRSKFLKTLSPRGDTWEIELRAQAPVVKGEVLSGRWREGLVAAISFAKISQDLDKTAPEELREFAVQCGFSEAQMKAFAKTQQAIKELDQPEHKTQVMKEQKSSRQQPEREHIVQVKKKYVLGAFLKRQSPRGGTWENELRSQTLEVTGGQLVGRWRECLEAAVVFTKANESVAAQADYAKLYGDRTAPDQVLDFAVHCDYNSVEEVQAIVKTQEAIKSIAVVKPQEEIKPPEVGKVVSTPSKSKWDLLRQKTPPEESHADEDKKQDPDKPPYVLGPFLKQRSPTGLPWERVLKQQAPRLEGGSLAGRWQLCLQAAGNYHKANIRNLVYLTSVQKLGKNAPEQVLDYAEHAGHTSDEIVAAMTKMKDELLAPEEEEESSSSSSSSSEEEPVPPPKPAQQQQLRRSDLRGHKSHKKEGGGGGGAFKAVGRLFGALKR